MKENKYYNKFWTIPNTISIIRIILSILLFIYIAINGITSPIIITIITIIIGGTDFIDGHIARSHNMTSKYGKIIDPIADKIFNWGIGITLMIANIMPTWPLLIGVRDIVVASISYYQLKKNNKLMTPTYPAKAKMLFQTIGVVSTIAFGFGHKGLSLIAPVFMALAISTALPEAFCIKDKYFNNPNKKD